MSGKRILVDGYNVIRRTPRWNELFRRDMSAARAALIQHCARMKSRHPDIAEIVVFFDGDSSVAAHHTSHVPCVRVVFTSTGVEADERIIEAVRNGAHHGTIVVSDDAEVAGRSRNLGASSMSVAEFQRVVLPGHGGSKSRPKRDVSEGKNNLTPSQQRDINDELRRAFGIE